MKFKGFGKDALMASVFLALSVFVGLFDFFDVPANAAGGQKLKAEVLSVDNSGIVETGLVFRGEQALEVKVLQGDRKGEVFSAQNMLRSQMDFDKIFKQGDTVLLAVPDYAKAGEHSVNAQDYYRTDKTIFLLSLFCILLLLFGGMVGLKALISFVFACVTIWKIVIPACLEGYNAVFICLAAVCALSAAIIFLVAGFTRKGVAAFSGTALGVLASCVMAWIFTHWFNINGATMPFSQVLFYSGYEYLNLSDLFVGALFLSSSGAVMDLSMDVAAGMDEVKIHNPQISSAKLMGAGLNIGRSVVGTMTTTLLLAYSGGYLTLMMTYTANGVSLTDFINSPYVCAEIVKTIVGSFGLVLVAPFTAFAGAFILSDKN